MSSHIEEALAAILTATYGEEVRQALYNALLEALNIKDNVETALNKSQDIDVDSNSTTKYPSVKAVAEYIALQIENTFKYDDAITEASYRADNHKIIYLNATLRNLNKKAVVITLRDPYARQFGFCEDGSVYTRKLTSPGGSYVPESWVYINADIISSIDTKMNAGRTISVTDESTLFSGYYYDFNTKSTYAISTGEYRQLTGVQSGEHFLCSGRTQGSYKYAFYGFLDSNGDVIMTYAPTLNTTYTDMEIVAPANAATLIVNGSASARTSIKRVIYDVDEFNSFRDSVEEQLSFFENDTQSKLNTKMDTQVFDNYVYETPAQIHEGYMKASNASITASATGRAYEYDVTPTDVLVCHGRAAASGATYPAFIFLDANRIPIGSYGSLNSTTYDETLIIPEGCAYLVINGTTNVSYTPYCYKRVYKSRPFNLGAAKNLRNIAARNPFAFNTSEFGDHGIVTFVFDDGHKDLDSICSIFEEYNYPVCLAIPPETLKTKCTELTATRGSFTVGMSVKQVCDVVVANGGEIMTHHFTPVTSDLQYDYDFMLDKYYTGKMALENAGYTVRGFIKAGGTGSVVRTPELEAWLNGNYEYSDSGIQLNYNLTRTSINQSLADLETLINSCATNKTWLRFVGHYYTTGGGTTFTGESDLRAILGYCQTAGVEVATYATVFDRYS